MKTGLIFDIDGTLWNSSQEVAEAWNAIFVKYPDYAKPCGKEDFMRVMGKTMTEIADIFLPNCEKEKQRQIMKECEEFEIDYLMEHPPVPYAGVVETLRSLARSYPLFIVSNCQIGYIDCFLKLSGLEEEVKDYICFGDNGFSKGDNIRLLAERNSLDKYYYIGDIQGDLDATRAAGGEFIYASYGFGEIKERVTAIEKIEDLLQIF